MVKTINQKVDSTFLAQFQTDGMKVKLTRLASCAAKVFFLNDSKMATTSIKETGKTTILMDSVVLLFLKRTNY